MSTYFTREEILAALDLAYRDEPVSEWGEGKVVRVVGLNAADASEFSNKMVKFDDKGQVQSMEMDKNMMADLLVRTLTNEKYEPIFTKDDIDALGKKSAKVIKRLFEIAMQLSGLGEESKQEAVKN